MSKRSPNVMREKKEHSYEVVKRKDTCFLGIGGLDPVNLVPVCTRHARWPAGNSGCHPTNTGGGREFERIEKSGAESHRQPYQCPRGESHQLRYWAGRPHPGGCKHPTCDSAQRGKGLEPHHSLDHANHLPATSRAAAARAPGATDRSLRLRRPEPFILPLA